MPFWILFSLIFFPSAFAGKANSSRLPIKITISVDWEGDRLLEENLQAMRDFRNAYPDIPLVHFLNAAYFTKNDGRTAAEVRDKIRSVLRPGDEFGLHIHAWKNLVEAAGVKYREGPTFWGTTESLPRLGEPGHDIPISAYTVDELRKLISFSVNTLRENGFTGIKSFRAGGWVGAPNVLEALVREGITADSSEVPREHIFDQLAKYPIYEHVGNIWGESHVTAAPHVIETPAGPITEFPDNGGLADYVDAATMLSVFKTNMAASKPGTEVRLHYGFHQETAAKYLVHVSEGLELIRREAAKLKAPIQPLTLTGTEMPPLLKSGPRSFAVCARETLEKLLLGH